MLGHLIRKEMLDQILSLRFAILSTVGALVIWLSLYDGYTYYQDRLRDYQLAQAATQERIQQLMVADGLVDENWSEVEDVGFLEHKRPVPMSIFLRGLDMNLGRSISNAYSTVRRLRRSPVEAEPILGVFPSLDLGLVVQIVLSLFALLLTYNAVCGEKEDGTLRLTASFPVPRHRLLLGKFIGVLIPMLAVYGLSLLLGIAVVLLFPEVQITGSEWVRLGIILIGFGFYLTAFVCAGLLGSCLTHRPATSFVLLLSFWVAIVVILPRLSLIVADSFKPAPSIHEYQAEREALSLHWNRTKKREFHNQWREEYFGSAEFWNTPKWRTPEGREASALKHAEVREKARLQFMTEVASLDEDFRNRYNARLELAVALARLSPAFAFKNATIRLAGTGIDRHQRFESAFMRDYINGEYWAWLTKTHDLDRLRRYHPEKYGEPTWTLSGLPRFAYREFWPEEEVQMALIDIGVLAIWGLAFFAGAWVAMLRYDLR